MIELKLTPEQANTLLRDVSRETQDTARVNRLGVRELAIQLLQGVSLTPREITNRLRELDSTETELAVDMATFPKRLAWAETIAEGKAAESQLADLAQTRNALAEEELLWREQFGQRVTALNDKHAIANGKVASATNTLSTGQSHESARDFHPVRTARPAQACVWRA